MRPEVDLNEQYNVCRTLAELLAVLSVVVAWKLMSA